MKRNSQKVIRALDIQIVKPKEKEKGKKLCNALHCTRNSVFSHSHGATVLSWQKKVHGFCIQMNHCFHLTEYREMITGGCSMAFCLFNSVVLMNQ